MVNQYPREPDQTLPEARCLLYRNEGAEGNWLKIKLEGIEADLDGIGSRVEVTVGDVTMIREIDGGSSHLSQNSTIAHFGLADNEVADKVVVKWLGGKTQELTNVAANQQITIQEVMEATTSNSENSLLIYPSIIEDRVVMEYELEEIGPIEFSVYDAQGRLVEDLIRIERPAKKGLWQWNVDRALSPGVYLIQMRTEKGLVGKRAMKF